MDSEVLVSLVIGLAIGSSTYVWYSNDFSKKQKLFLIFLILFPPLQWVLILLLLIYKGYKNESNSKEQDTNKTFKKDLYELKEKGLINENEYKLKNKKLEEKINKNNLKKSKEYNQLINLLESDILTQEEFDNKIKLLNNKNIKESVPYFRIVDGFSDGLGLAINSDLDYGYVNLNNEIEIPFIFDHAENFNNNRALVRINGEFKFINKKGVIIK
jgi:hypothetical protein